MNIDIEFFDDEPIENLITCMNFKMDKVIYFGYESDMTTEKCNITKKSLKKICDIENVEFKIVDKNNLDKIVEEVEKVIKSETADGNQCFFELTGGQELELVAMGILSAKYQLPMHRFDIVTGKLQVLNENGGRRIDTLVQARKVNVTLDDIIEMYGGAIDYNEKKSDDYYVNSEEFECDVKNMWQIAKKNKKRWNCISTVFKSFTGYETSETKVSVWSKKVNSVVTSTQGVEEYEVFKKYFYDLKNIGVIINVKNSDGKLEFEYKNKMVKQCIIEAGELLELSTFYKYKNTEKYKDCKVGVNINWDADVGKADDGVENEVDVMLLEGYRPVFISCKNGKVTQMALYELETVANRFGGKYAKKIMVAGLGLTAGYAMRASEMGIEVDNEI